MSPRSLKSLSTLGTYNNKNNDFKKIVAIQRPKVRVSVSLRTPRSNKRQAVLSLLRIPHPFPLHGGVALEDSRRRPS